MEVVMVVVVVLLSSLGVSSLSMFIRKCFEPNMIFRRYFLWLTYKWIKNWRKKDRYKRKILKPLGLCIYCLNTWLSIIAFSLFVYFLNISILLLPLYIGISYLWLEIILKLK